MSRKPRPSRCPQCRTRDLVLVEVSTIGMGFHQCTDGHVRRIWGYSTEAEFSYVLATCLSCRHRWRLRGTEQIPGLIERRDDERPGSPDPTCKCDGVP